MYQMDWDRVLLMKTDSLTDDEIEDLFPMVVRCDIDDIEDVNNLRVLMKLCQEMLQHKDNQVESLLLECDDLREKMTLSQSSLINNQEKVSKKPPSDVIETDDGSQHVDAPTTKTFRENANATDDKIRSLLNELESLEEENDRLKRKLEILKEEMEDATENMDEMTDELERLKSKNLLYIDEINELQQEKEALKIQLEATKVQPAESQRIIDDFSGVIDAKVDEWKKILAERDTEIDQLKKELSCALAQSVPSMTEQNKAEIAHLNEQIDEGKRIIVDLQEKLLEAARELNDSAALIEKLKNDAKKLTRTGRRKEQRDLLKKIRDANERIASLQNTVRQAEDESTLKSEQLCQVLGDLKKYEDRDRGMAETIKETRELREKLNHKHNNIKELINVINNLEMLNSCREMQILALREKLGIPEDEEITIDGIALKSQEDARVRDELIKRNQTLEHENFEMKSDIRILRYKLSKLEQKLSTNGDTIIYMDEADTRSKKMTKYHGIAEEDLTALRQRAEFDELGEKIQIVIEENEALRKGMHEILDCIHDQDGKSEVEVHSETLERLLEALDVRHISGWYHPAMRLQERLNVVQGSNSELRAQLKQMRKELHKRDVLFQKYAIQNVSREMANSENPENSEEVKKKETEQSESTYRNDLENCRRERESLNQENHELRETVHKLKEQLESLEADFKTLESGEDEIKAAFASKSRECTESALNDVAMKKKCATLENLLNKETARSYTIRKESIETENALRKFLLDVEKRNKMLNIQIDTLQSNLSNSVSLVEYNELKDKYAETCIRLRAAYETRLAVMPTENIVSEKTDDTSERETTTNVQAKYETSVKELMEINSELRQQLIDAQKLFTSQARCENLVNLEENESNKNYEERIRALTLENENLGRRLEISQEEIEMHSTTNSLRIFELDSLRHQILDLHVVSDNKETISRLSFELNICKNNEVELSKRKVQLENEILHLRDDLEGANKELDNARMQVQDCRKACATRCRSYEDVINFLRCQYVGSTSLTSLDRFNAMFQNIVKNRAETDEKMKEANELERRAIIHKETLMDRLEIVAKLKDVLEKEIGTIDVESVIQNFSENSQYTLNDIRLKRKINRLENDLRSLNDKLLEYQSTIVDMEYEMINIQRIWYKKPEAASSASESRSETKVEQRTVSIQAQVENQSKEVQSEPCDFDSKNVVSKLSEVSSVEEAEVRESDMDSIGFIREQLDQALALASDRSATLITYESRVIEYQAKIESLEATIAEKNAQLSRSIEQQTLPKETDEFNLGRIDNAAFESTISSMRKMLDQKEETIERYQNLLKNDRDEHSNAAARFQREIKVLREEIFRLHEEIGKKPDTLPLSAPVISTTIDEPVKETNSNIASQEEIARLAEKASTLETELSFAKDLAERWHRLAEERLQHVDHMRDRLEEQHRNELESYRLELNKWQTEADTLRQQLSENRMQLAKGNMSLAKELQERDNKIHELNIAYQQLQADFEIMEAMTLSQSAVAHDTHCSTKMKEMAQTLTRDQTTHFQSEIDLLKRQIKSQNDKEKMYKDQITDLKQQISRIYMAKKSEERKVSNREIQLEKKLKSLEEELHKAHIQLDKEYRLQEAKRVKTAEELALWEKQKKWQQIAEKTKRELKEKIEEHNKLNVNYEKLRAIVLCMEREKWYLRSKLKSENASFPSGLIAPVNDAQYKVIESLQRECRTLKERVKELTEQLESEASRQSEYHAEQQKIRITALETVAQGNTFVLEQLERLERARANLEKSNIHLESENFELRMEIEKRNLDTPRLREKVEHLEKYVELLKTEKSSDSSPRSPDKNFSESKKSVIELEKTVFILKRIIEKLQVENKRLQESPRKGYRQLKTSREIDVADGSSLRKHYEVARKRIVALETDLQLAEQRISMLENARREEGTSDEIEVLKQQLAHKSELLDKVKQLLTRAALNEKALRQKIQQMELKQTLSTIPECSLISPTE